MRTPSSSPSRFSAIPPDVIRADLQELEERAGKIHWSLTAAAGRAGVNGSTIAKWRKGVPVVHATYARHLARIWQELEREEEALRRYLGRPGGERQQRRATATLARAATAGPGAVSG